MTLGRTNLAKKHKFYQNHKKSRNRHFVFFYINACLSHKPLYYKRFMIMVPFWNPRFMVMVQKWGLWFMVIVGKIGYFCCLWMFKNDCLWFMSIVGKSWRISFVYDSGSNYIVFWFILRLHSLKVRCEFRYKNPKNFPLRGHWTKEIDKQKTYHRFVVKATFT